MTVTERFHDGNLMSRPRTVEVVARRSVRVRSCGCCAAVRRWPGRAVTALRRCAEQTDLRWGEMAALRMSDFDMLRRVNVSRSATESGGLVWSMPKTWERRSVPFPAALADELAALMVGKGRDDLVFTGRRGGVRRKSNWRAGVRVSGRAVPEGRRLLLVDNPARLEAHGSESRGVGGRERQCGAADVGPRQGIRLRSTCTPICSMRTWVAWRQIWMPRSDLLHTDCVPGNRKGRT
jgi:integrase